MTSLHVRQRKGLKVDASKILEKYMVKQHHVNHTLTGDAASNMFLEKCNFILYYQFGADYIKEKSGIDEKSEPLGNKKEEQNAEQSNISSQTHKILKDAKMRETHQQGTEASDITKSESGESRNATANVEGCTHNANQCPQGISGTKSNGKYALPILCSESNLNKDDRLGHRKNLNNGS